MVDTMVDEKKTTTKKQNKTVSQTDIKPADAKGNNTTVIWADSRDFCFCCSFSPKHLRQCNTVRLEATQTRACVREAKEGCDRMIAVGLLEGIWSISIRVLICCELLQAVVGRWLLWDCLDEFLNQSALLSLLMRSYCSSTQTHKPISAFQIRRLFLTYTQVWTGCAGCKDTHPHSHRKNFLETALQFKCTVPIHSCRRERNMLYYLKHYRLTMKLLYTTQEL